MHSTIESFVEDEGYSLLSNACISHVIIGQVSIYGFPQNFDTLTSANGSTIDLTTNTLKIIQQSVGEKQEDLSGTYDLKIPNQHILSIELTDDGQFLFNGIYSNRFIA